MKRFSFRRSLPSHTALRVFSVCICVFWSVGHITLRCCITKLSVPHKTIIARENISCNFFSRVHYLVAAIAFDVESESFYFYFRTKTITACLKITDVALLCFLHAYSASYFFRFHFVRPFFFLSSEILTNNLLSLFALS